MAVWDRHGIQISSSFVCPYAVRSSTFLRRLSFPRTMYHMLPRFCLARKFSEASNNHDRSFPPHAATNVACFSSLRCDLFWISGLTPAPFLSFHLFSSGLFGFICYFFFGRPPPWKLFRSCSNLLKSSSFLVYILFFPRVLLGALNYFLTHATLVCNALRELFLSSNCIRI
jgi:hypothetical protein